MFNQPSSTNLSKQIRETEHEVMVIAKLAHKTDILHGQAVDLTRTNLATFRCPVEWTGRDDDVSQLRIDEPRMARKPLSFRNMQQPCEVYSLI